MALEDIVADDTTTTAWAARLDLDAEAAGDSHRARELRELIQHSLSIASRLVLRDETYLEQFIRLRIRLTPQQLASTLAQGVLRRIMTNLDWSPRKRLGFLEQHLIDRPVSENEPDFGPGFIPPWEPRYPPPDEDDVRE